jgi:hypothetical protein
MSCAVRHQAQSQHSLTFVCGERRSRCSRSSVSSHMGVGTKRARLAAGAQACMSSQPESVCCCREPAWPRHEVPARLESPGRQPGHYRASDHQTLGWAQELKHAWAHSCKSVLAPHGIHRAAGAEPGHCKTSGHRTPPISSHCGPGALHLQRRSAGHGSVLAPR